MPKSEKRTHFIEDRLDKKTKEHPITYDYERKKVSFIIRDLILFLENLQLFLRPLLDCFNFAVNDVHVHVQKRKKAEV